MISYLLEGTCLAALLGVSVKLFLMGRQIRVLRDYHEQNQFVLDEMVTAATAIDASIRDLNSHGAQVLLALGERIGDGHKLVSEIDERMDAVAEHYEAERTAASNVLQFAAAAGKAAMRQSEARVEKHPVQERDMREEYDDEPRRPQPQPRRPVRQEVSESSAAPRRAPLIDKEVKWPTLGDRFNSWRNSDVEEQRKAPRSRPLDDRRQRS